MSPSQILLTGASGYIGGSVLQQLLRDFGDDLQISALVRSVEARDAVKALGVTPIHFGGLHDLEILRDSASDHDVVISCASSLDEPSCLALVQGLGRRSKALGEKVYYLHTSGASSFGDHPISGVALPDDVRSDTDNIYEWEKENSAGWITRKVDVAVLIEAALLNVQVAIVNPPLIYGTGTGPIHKHSIQIPALTKISLALGQAVVLGQGNGIWDIVHIEDVASFYSILTKRIVEGAHVVFGEKGYYFLDGGQCSWLDVSNHIGKVGYGMKLFSSTNPRRLSPSDFSQALNIPWLNEFMVEVIWGSNARIRGVQSRKLGWKPRKTMSDFTRSIQVTVQELSGSES